MPTRVLILSAGIGEGHDLPARMLADGLARLDPAIDAPVVDGLAAMGRLSSVVADDGSDFMFEKANWLFDLTYVLIARFPPTRALTRALTHRLGSRGLLRLIAERRPDVIVSTYPGVTETLGYLRARGRIAVPVVSAITDLAGLHYWAHPGMDLHLVTEPESIDEVHRVAPGSPVVCVRGLISPAFEEPVDQAQARRALDLPPDGPLIVVSGGGWAVGDLAGATRAALDAAPDATVARALRPQRREARRARARVPRRAAAADARLHRSHGRRAGRRGRPRPLDRRAHGVRGAAARLPCRLLRLGRLAHPAEQRGLPPVRAGPGRGRPRRAGRRAAPRARRAARARHHVRAPAGRRRARCSR